MHEKPMTKQNARVGAPVQRRYGRTWLLFSVVASLLILLIGASALFSRVPHDFWIIGDVLGLGLLLVLTLLLAAFCARRRTGKTISHTQEEDAN